MTSINNFSPILQLPEVLKYCDEHSHQTLFKFLGTMAGKQIYLNGNDGKPTCARTYEPFGPFDIRKNISQVGYILSYRCKEIGEQYNSAEGWNIDFRGTTINRGGFFRTVKTFEENDPEQWLNCYAYALGIFGPALEKLAGKSIEQIQDSVTWSINAVVQKYFTNVHSPEEGDLAIYSVEPYRTIYTPNSVKVYGITHAGIYRKEGGYEGTIESKWGWCAQPHVFQHEPFFVPDFYGNRITFYRIKKSPD